MVRGKGRAAAPKCDDPEVLAWISDNAVATGKSDIHLVVGRKKQEVRIPVSKAVLAIHSGLVRELPDTDDVPVIGPHEPRTVVQYASLCYPRLDAPVPAFTLVDIGKLARLAHWLDSPQVVDLLYGQLKKRLDALAASYSGDKSFMSTKDSLDPEIYFAIFALRDAGKDIPLTDNLIMHYPDWYTALSEEDRAPHAKYSVEMFEAFMSKFEDVSSKHTYMSHTHFQILRDASAKLLTVTRHLLALAADGPPPAKRQKSSHGE